MELSINASVTTKREKDLSFDQDYFSLETRKVKLCKDLTFSKDNPSIFSDKKVTTKNIVECKILAEEKFYSLIDKKNTRFLDIIPIQCREHIIVQWDSSDFEKKNEITREYDSDEGLKYPASYEIVGAHDLISIDLIERSTLLSQCKQRIYQCFTQPLSKINKDVSWRCHNFAIYLAKGKITNKIEEICCFYNKYRQVNFDKKYLEPGDIILIFDKDSIKIPNEFYKHSMFFLGENYVLHKLGKRTMYTIMVTTLDSFFANKHRYPSNCFSIIIKTSELI